MRLLPLLALPFLAWLLPVAPKQSATEALSPEKVNLALRRTADALLRAAGDSTSRIPAIEQSGERVWRVQIEQPFSYDQLPALLQASLDLHDIRQPYQVAVRRCDDEAIDLGYHYLDFLEKDSSPPCGGREMPEGCHFIELEFLETGKNWPLWGYATAFLLLILGGALGFWSARRRRSAPVEREPRANPETAWLAFGASRLDVAGQVLVCAGTRQTLTFRETKLLRLFANNPDRLLERDFILQHVWADEGILVGRSMDMFVSRLRKKLAADPSVAITTVHGVGYRLELKG